MATNDDVISYAEAQLKTQRKILQFLADTLRGSFEADVEASGDSPEAAAFLADYTAELDRLFGEFDTYTRPPRPVVASGWSSERRSNHGKSISDAWARKKDEMRLYLYEWAGEPPTRVTYEEASERLNLAAATLRVRVSRSDCKAVLVYRGGRWLALCKLPDSLEAALNERYVESGNPDDIFVLAKRSKPRGDRPHT